MSPSLERSVVIAEPWLPPVAEQVRRIATAAVSHLQVAVMLQNFNDIDEVPGSVRYP